ncbi:MAG: hypothetical protein JSS50_04565 [Proteobacteria bacterium]|nr:hypothetical protein [Pseudomonadota bacterium]
MQTSQHNQIDIVNNQFKSWTFARFTVDTDTEMSIDTVKINTGTLIYVHKTGMLFLSGTVLCNPKNPIKEMYDARTNPESSVTVSGSDMLVKTLLLANDVHIKMTF